MPLASGTQLGPCQIVAPLGAGGMGEEYRARDTRLDLTVAIKISPKQLSNDSVGKLRFEREAKTISSLNHPHICVLHDVGSQDRSPTLSGGVFRFSEAKTSKMALINPLESALMDDPRVGQVFGRNCPSVSPLESALAKKTRGWRILC
jgi:serine/threonine protein kinase